MFEARNSQIKITRGDSASLKVMLKMSNGDPYEMASGDTLTLTVRRRPGDTKLAEITSSTDTLAIAPADTKDLEAGLYCFDIQLTTSGGDIFTVVGMNTGTLTNFTVLPEITE